MRLFFAISIGNASAQDYPNRPIRLVVPVAPGGVIDYVGRTLAQQLSEGLGQPVVVENRPGAGGITGTDSVARSAADGYTLVLMDMGIVVNPSLRPSSVPYDLFTQLQTVSIVSSSPLVVVVSPTMPVKTFAEFMAYGKTKPAKFNFASPGDRVDHASGGRDFQAALRGGCDPCRLPRRWVLFHRPDERRNPVRLQQHRRRPVLDQQQSHTRASPQPDDRAVRSFRTCRP